MKNKRVIVALTLTLVATFVMWPVQVTTVVEVRDDRVMQCSDGILLFRHERYHEALPVLAAGFAGRYEATFPDPTILDAYALIPGTLSSRDGEETGTLEVY